MCTDVYDSFNLTKQYEESCYMKRVMRAGAIFIILSFLMDAPRTFGEEVSNQGVLSCAGGLPFRALAERKSSERGYRSKAEKALMTIAPVNAEAYPSGTGAAIISILVTEASVEDIAAAVWSAGNVLCFYSGVCLTEDGGVNFNTGIFEDLMSGQLERKVSRLIEKSTGGGRIGDLPASEKTELIHQILRVSDQVTALGNAVQALAAIQVLRVESQSDVHLKHLFDEADRAVEVISAQLSSDEARKSFEKAIREGVDSFYRDNSIRVRVVEDQLKRRHQSLMQLTDPTRFVGVLPHLIAALEVNIYIETKVGNDPPPSKALQAGIREEFPKVIATILQHRRAANQLLEHSPLSFDISTQANSSFMEMIVEWDLRHLVDGWQNDLRKISTDWMDRVEAGAGQTADEKRKILHHYFSTAYVDEVRRVIEEVRMLVGSTDPGAGDQLRKLLDLRVFRVTNDLLWSTEIMALIDSGEIAEIISQYIEGTDVSSR